MRNFIITIMAVAVIAACSDSKSGSGSSKSPEIVSSNDVGSDAGEHKGLSPEYLHGDWCFTHIEFPDTRSEENINYYFEVDGTYSAQQSKNRPLEPGWKYTFLPDGKFKLSLPRFTTSVLSVEADTFILHAFGDLHFQRGSCS